MTRKKNIIMICTDHQRADYLSCIGHPMIKTPNLDKLAGRGTLFENLYVQSTVCMPSRASIMTGTYSCRHGVTNNGYDLLENNTTIAHVLRESGYHTMAVGRTHLICTQPQPEYSKTDFYGFNQCAHAQVYCGDTDPGNDYLSWVKENHPELYDDVAFCNRELEGDMHGGHTQVPEELNMTSWVTQRSLEFIQGHQEKSTGDPFFLWAGTWDPHSPYRAPEPWGSMYKPDDIPLPARTEDEFEGYPESLKQLAIRKWKKNPAIPIEKVWQNSIAMYMGMVSYIDHEIGKLLDGLDKMGLTDDTIVLFTSDHGDMLGEHWFIGKRIYFYDGALKVPGIVAGPGVPENMRIKGLAESVDLMPTLLDLAGIELAPEVQGQSWLPVMNGDKDIIHNDVYTDYQFQRNPPGIPEDESKNEHCFSIFDGRYRIVCFKNREYGQLFDFKKDPGNHINYWNDPEYNDVKKEMQLKLLNRLMNNLSQPDTRQAEW